MVGSRVELFAAIRHDARVDGLSIRQLADKHRVHRRTVRQALASAVPPPRKIPTRSAPRLDPFKAAIDGMLRGDLNAPRKQRHTARRVLARLVDEHDAGALSYSTVRDYVARRRTEILIESGRKLGDGFVPQVHQPAAEGEVDFADLWIVLRGTRTKVSLFTLRLSHSGKAVHRAFLSQGQEAFLEGHVYAFDVIAGLPERIRHDNLKSAVRRVLFGRERFESDRWVAFRSQYGFDAFYCLPGVEGAHEKGGVEGEVGRFRRTHCVPMPVVGSIDELNLRFAHADAKDEHRRIDNRTNTVIGRRVRVQVGASELVVFDGRTEVARHERSGRKGGQVLLLDHYLEVLRRKPGALPGATALAQARAAGTFTAAHEAFWAAARRALGDTAGTRALIAVLLLHRHLTHVDVIAGITAALSVGSVNLDVVAVEARKAAAPPRSTAPGELATSLNRERVVSLPGRRPAEPPADDRPLPSVTAYDDLLGKAMS